MLSPQLERFDADPRRPSIAPEKLLRSLLLKAFYTVPSEQELIEQLDYNLLFRWFVGLPMDAPPWDAAEFAANRQRLSSGDAASRFLSTILSQPRVKLLLSDDHFSPDGRLIEAWARPESSQSRRWCTPSGAGRSAECDSYGENGERLPYHPARPTAR